MAISRFSTVRLALALSVSVPAMAAAQEYNPPSVPPVRETIDENGVDLSRGILVDRAHSVAIGDASDPGMLFARVVVSDGSYRDSTSGVITANGNVVTVSIAGGSETFTRYANGNYVSDQRTGATLTASGGSAIYTASDGTVATFAQIADRTMYVTGGSSLTSLTRPDGEIFTSHYKIIPVCIKMDTGICEVEATAARLQSVTSNRGYELKLGFQSNVAPVMIQDTRPWMTINKATLINGTVDYCDPQADLCSYSRTWPSLTMNGTSSFTDSMGRVTSYTFTAGRLTAIKRPGASSPNVAIAYDASGKVSSVTRDGVTTTYAYADASGVRTTTINAGGAEERVVKFTLADMLRSSDEDALDNVTSFTYYPATGQLKSVTAPELNKTEYEYDSRGNIIKVTATPKPGSPLAPIITQASYPASDISFPERCAAGIAAAVCNMPVTTTDPRGHVTNYSYASHGGVTAVTRPAPVIGAARPETRYAYTPLYAWYKNSAGALVQAPQPIQRLTGVSQCITGTSCAGAANETRTEIAYQGGSASNPSNLLPVAITQKAGDNSLAVTTTLAHDAIGDVTGIDGPLPGADDTTTLRYNFGRERTGAISPDPDGAGPLKRRAERLSYNDDGQVTLAELGTVAGTTDPDWAAFVSLQQRSAGYDANARLVREGVSGGGTEYQVTQHSYDARGRLDCSAVRMNPAEFASLPASACSLDTQGSFGPDRITRISYDPVGRATKVTSAYGTAVAADDASATYTANGRTATLTDAEGNVTSYVYDGHGRPAQTFYPSPVKGSGTSSPTDYMQATYDAASNVTALRLRDSQSISFTYDNLSRLTFKDLPGSEPDATYAYDNLGRLTSASQPGHAVGFTYDALGRRLAESGPHGTVSSQYDLAGRRTRLTWPDAYYVTYEYDGLDRNTVIRANGAGYVVVYGYDDLGRRASLAHGDLASTTYGYDGISRLSSLTHDLAGTAHDLTLGFAYNPASQIVSNSRSNDLYAWTGHGSGSTASTVNGLNELISVGSAVPAYDARGNMTSDGVRNFTYSPENLLTGATGGVTLAYDPLGRLYQLGGTRFLYDGDRPIAEYDYGGAIVARYIHGAGIDEPVYAYAGGTGRYLIADERGSIIAQADNWGNVTGINAYDEYGVPASTNAGRFQYTGQAWLPEMGLYYYKARMYHPELGRFMQTDPIGYAGGMNLYNYVGSDPVNFTDPSGLVAFNALCTGGYHYTLPDGSGVVVARKCSYSEGAGGPRTYIGSLGPYPGPALERDPGSGCSTKGAAMRARLNALASNLGPVTFDSASEVAVLAQYFRGDTTAYRLNGGEFAQARSYVGTYGDSVLGSSVTRRGDGLTERNVFFGRFASDAPLLDGLLGTATGVFSGDDLVGVRDTFNFDFKERGGYPYGTSANLGVAMIRADAASCAGDVSIPISGGTP